MIYRPITSQSVAGVVVVLQSGYDSHHEADAKSAGQGRN